MRRSGRINLKISAHMFTLARFTVKPALLGLPVLSRRSPVCSYSPNTTTSHKSTVEV